MRRSPSGPSPVAQPHNGALWQHCKNSALSYFNNSRILVPILRCLEDPPSASLPLPATSLLGPSRQPEDADTPPSSALSNLVLFLHEVRMEEKENPIPSVPSLLSLLVNRDDIQTSEYAFSNANIFTGSFECNRLKIKSEVWNGTANLNLLLSEYCIAAWITDFFQDHVSAECLFFKFLIKSMLF